MPKSVYLLRNRNIKAIASYNRQIFAGFHSLIIEGICLDPSIQGKGIFREITNKAIKNEEVVCLRTQNPRMYRALAKYCRNIYPSDKERSIDIKATLIDFAEYLKCSIDSNGVIKGYYGGLFYGEEPSHQQVDFLFKKLGIDLYQGDGLLVIGTVEPMHMQDGLYSDYLTNDDKLRLN